VIGWAVWFGGVLATNPFDGLRESPGSWDWDTSAEMDTPIGYSQALVITAWVTSIVFGVIGVLLSSTEPDAWQTRAGDCLVRLIASCGAGIC
jgi:hypothetical protein